MASEVRAVEGPIGGGPLGLVTCVRGDAFAVSGPDGEIRPGGVRGVFVRDTRFLDQLELLVDGAPTAPLSSHLLDGAQAVFHSHVPAHATDAGDPTVVIERQRVLDGSMRERIVLRNHGEVDRTVEVALVVGTDFAYVADVKHGRELPRVTLGPVEGGGAVDHRGGAERVEVRCDPPAALDGDRLVVRADLPARTGVATIVVDVVVTDTHGTTRPADASPGHRPADARGAADDGSHGPLTVRSADHRLDRLVHRSLLDLRALTVADPLDPGDRFYAAGSPWYLTLFGRDALWSALMALPAGTEAARGTLRALARRQGQRHDPETEEAPGKILHEIRRGGLAERGDLPPTYYGTVDATPLFVVLLSEAWRWGLDEPTVRDLLPNVRAALDWMVTDGDPSGDGLIAYVRSGDRGLTNQGWKDSEDGVRFADGSVAAAPIALVEVQAYAHDAALRAAELLDRAGDADADRWREYAAGLADRVRERFWVEDDDGRYPAIGLDRDGAPVDSPASNMGHLLASGMLDADETAAVASRLADPAMDSGWGLRTMSATAAGYNPFSYHAGSVWPHDTAIAAWGLARCGHGAAATSFIRGLVAAGPAFAYRLPELFSGVARGPSSSPIPYPASCRPQAWSAGAALLVLRTLLGLEPHLPVGRVRLRPLWPPPIRELEVRGVRIGAGTLDVRVHAEHGVDLEPHGIDAEFEVTLP